MSTQPTSFCQYCGQPIAAASPFCSQCGRPQPGGPSPAAAAAAAPAFAASSATAYVAAPSVTYAGFWMRFLAIVIDGLVVGVVTGPVTLIVEAAMGFGGAFNITGDKPDINPGQIAMIAGMFAFIVVFSVAAHALYEALLTASKKQATVGKMVFRIKVTDLEGRRISIPRAFGRHFAKYVSGMTLAIGYLIQPFTARRQALHDLIAGTLVMRDVSPPYPIVPPQTAPPAQM